MAMELEVALIASAAGFVTAAVAGVISEAYKRHRDSTSLAAALAGELRVAVATYPSARRVWVDLGQRASAGNLLNIPKTDDVGQIPIFKANIERVGLLGPDLAGEVAYVYSCITGFRSAVLLLMDVATPEQQASLITTGVGAMDRAFDQGRPLIEKLSLKARSVFLEM